MTFDDYADSYDAALQLGLDATGEDRDFFARGRVDWLARCLRYLAFHPTEVVDFGCGTGGSIRHLRDLSPRTTVIGVDASTAALDLARQQQRDERVCFEIYPGFVPTGRTDLVFSNGVFHHIRPERRAEILDLLHLTLRPGGLFALWENNPYNPGTRLVMRRIPFDRDAILVSPSEARRMLRCAGFEIVSTHFMFVFPRMMRRLRSLEPYLVRLPLGGQYQVLARRKMPPAEPA